MLTDPGDARFLKLTVNTDHHRYITVLTAVALQNVCPESFTILG